MMMDARSISCDQELTADVCIVGAGTAGLTLAAQLAKTALKVMLIESGGLKPDKGSNQLNWGENIGLNYYALDTARARYFGGSTNRWHVSIGNQELGARIRPLDEIDFEERDYLPHSGWPFAKDHLDPYYRRSQEICRTIPPSYAVNEWFGDSAYQKLPFDAAQVETIAFKFCAKDTLLKEFEKAVQNAANLQVLLFANLVSIQTDEAAKSVKKVKVASLNGNRFTVSAKLFVLAAGGIEVPRLLLSSDQVMNCGLGNQNDLVGRYFMEHLHFWSGVFVPKDNRLIEKTRIYNDVRRIKGVPVIAKLALPEALMRQKKLINHNVQLIPRVVLRSTLHPYLWREFSSNPQGSSKALPAAFRKVIVKAGTLLDRRRSLIYKFANMTEQIPNPDSRVTLGPNRDNLGVRIARLNWQVSPQDTENAVRVQEIIGKEIERSGLGRLFIQLRHDSIPPDLHGGYHHMGTTRMHRDPQKGVVDPDCRVHGISNLFIAGPSVFPTGGHANPVLTILALTLRLSEHIRKVFEN
jgi:choline dehydrogenase-like flavoprotein